MVANTETIIVSEHSTRAELLAAIEQQRARHQRMPAHWVERRAEVGDAIDDMVTLWLDAKA